VIVNGWMLPKDDTHFPKYAEAGDYQPTLMGMALNYVTDFTAAVDAGGHIGFMSRRLTRSFERVWSFEPVPENFDCLRINAPKATAIRVALGNDRGEIEMACPAVGNSGSWERGDGITVPLMKLDDYPISSVGFVKIDVQGMETDVLLGGEMLIRKSRPVIAVEVKMRGETNHAVEALLLSWGARIAARIGKDIVAVWQ